MGVAPESRRFFQGLYVDFLGPYPRSRSGHVGIFIVLDHYSKFVFLKAIKKQTAEIITRYMEQDLFHTFGVPQTIISDNGSQFKSDIFQEFLRKWKIARTLKAVYSP